MADHVKHGKYISELKTNTSIYKQIVAPQVAVVGSRDLDGANFSFGMSFLTEPFLMVKDSHKHDFDQILFFLGGSPNNVADFDGEVELTLEDQKYLITYPSCVYIPAGLMHTPLNIKTVVKPFIFIDITLSPGLSIRPLPEASKR
jgi:mannose-6-phosphate isomerase-like protein (cupin superfamily)